MGRFTVETKHVRNWGNSSKYDYYGEVTIDATKNASNNTFTATIVSVRVYCSQYNFASSVQLQLSGGGKSTSKFDGSRLISASGSNSYGGYSASYKISGQSITVNGNADGSCPDIKLFAYFYAHSILNVSTGKRVNFDSYYGGTSTGSSIPVQNNAGGKNDVTPPTVTLLAGSFNNKQVTFSFKSNTGCNNWQYHIWDSTGWDGGWSNLGIGNGSNSGSKTVNISGNCVYYIQVRATKASTTKTGTSNQISFDARQPFITKFNLIRSSRNTIKFEIQVNNSPGSWSYRISGNGLPEATSWSSSLNSGQTVTVEKTVNNIVGSFTLDVRRVSNTSFTTSKTATKDMVLPSFNVLSFIPTSDRTADLTIKSNYDCTYEITAPSYIKKSGSINKNSNFISKDTSVIENSIVNYTITIKRRNSNDSTESLLDNSKILQVDTVRPTIILDSVKTVANSITFVAHSSDYDCKSWKHALRYTDDSGWVILGSSSKSNTASKVKFKTSTIKKGNKVEYTIQNVPMNVDLMLKVYACRVDNNAEGYNGKNEKDGFSVKCVGVGQIFDEDEEKFQQVICMIYDEKNSIWKSAIPYVYDSNSRDWKYGLPSEK